MELTGAQLLSIIWVVVSVINTIAVKFYNKERISKEFVPFLYIPIINIFLIPGALFNRFLDWICSTIADWLNKNK